MAHNYNGTPIPQQNPAEVARDMAESANVLKNIQAHEPAAAAEAGAAPVAPAEAAEEAARGGRLRQAAHAVGKLVLRKGKRAPSETQGVDGGRAARREAQSAERRRQETAVDAKEGDAILRNLHGPKLPAEAAAETDSPTWADAETAELPLVTDKHDRKAKHAAEEAEAGEASANDAEAEVDPAEIEDLMDALEAMSTPEGFEESVGKPSVRERIGTWAGTKAGKAVRFAREKRAARAAKKRGDTEETPAVTVDADVEDEAILVPVGADAETPRRGGKLHRAKEYAATGLASLTARLVLGGSKLREGSQAKMDRLPPRTRKLLRALDLGQAALFTTAVVRTVMIAKGHAVPDMPHDSAADVLHGGGGGGMHLAGFTEPSSPDLGADAGNNATVHVEHFNLDGSTPATAAATAGEHTPSIGGYHPLEHTYTAAEHDPLTGRATNASDMSEMSFRASFAVAGVPQEEVTKLLHDHPDLISKANHHLFASNPSINVHDKFHGGLNAGDTYKTEDLTKYTTEYASKWGAEHGYHPVDLHSGTGHPGHNTTGEETTSNGGRGTQGNTDPGKDSAGSTKAGGNTVAAAGPSNGHDQHTPAHQESGHVSASDKNELGIEWGLAGLAGIAAAERGQAAAYKAERLAHQEADKETGRQRREQQQRDQRDEDFRQIDEQLRGGEPEDESYEDFAARRRQEAARVDQELEQQLAEQEVANEQVEQEDREGQSGPPGRRNHKRFGFRGRRDKNERAGVRRHRA